NADAVQEHDQAGQADRSDDLGLRRKGADRKTYEQHRAYPERKPGDADLADQVAQPDRQKRRQDRLTADDVACEIQHASKLPGLAGYLVDSARLTPRGTELFDPPVHQIAAGRLGVFELVFKAHRLPLERTHLVEWLL